MSKTRLLSFDMFKEYHDKDKFFAQITAEQNVLSNLLSHYILLVLLSGVYGIVMGSHNGIKQAISSGIKVPLFLSLVILICFPVFFIIQFVLGSRLGLQQMLKIILSGFVMVALVMVAFAPIVIFFLITGDNYAFLKLLHVAIFAVSGFFGMKMILDALHFACEQKKVYPKEGVAVFQFWLIIMAFVGMQLAWNLRPFIGAKNLPFEILRQREGNFYLAVAQSIGSIVNDNK